MVKVIHEAIGIKHGAKITHDPRSDEHRMVWWTPLTGSAPSRSAMMSLQPTTTGSAPPRSTLIYPDLKGKLNGHAVQVRRS